MNFLSGANPKQILIALAIIFGLIYLMINVPRLIPDLFNSFSTFLSDVLEIPGKIDLPIGGK